MHEVRWNPLLSRQVVFAPRRASRPQETAGEDRGAGDRTATGVCALCMGNESETPPEVFSVRTTGGPDEPGWKVRVVPNLYPAVDGPGRSHEVVVHSPLHKTRLAELDTEETGAVGEAWVARLEAVSSDPLTRYFQAGINQGRDAGASLEHSHSQLLAIDFEPPFWRAEVESLADPADCPLCAPIGEKDAGGLGGVVDSGGGAVALCPSWSEFPYEVLAFPREHSATFLEDNDAFAWTLSLMGRLDGALEKVTGARTFNVVFHSGLPGRTPGRFHWHAHFYPRIAAVASIELGTGIHISTVDNEKAAADLWEVIGPPDY